MKVDIKPVQFMVGFKLKLNLFTFQTIEEFNSLCPGLKILAYDGVADQKHGTFAVEIEEGFDPVKFEKNLAPIANIVLLQGEIIQAPAPQPAIFVIPERP